MCGSETWWWRWWGGGFVYVDSLEIGMFRFQDKCCRGCLLALGALRQAKHRVTIISYEQLLQFWAMCRLSSI